MARELHRFMGFSIVGGWALLLLMGLMLVVSKRPAGRPYWGLLTLLQVALGLQVLAGLGGVGQRRPPAAVALRLWGGGALTITVRIGADSSSATKSGLECTELRCHLCRFGARIRVGYDPAPSE
jgi:hypothetical protein